MSKDELREYEIAADKICGECVNDDGDECDRCRVRLTLDRLRDAMKEES